VSDDILDVVDIMTLAEHVYRLSEKVEMLRSEVDTIGNVLLQLIHARNEQLHLRGGEE
jgi:hypothetical protein